MKPLLISIGLLFSISISAQTLTVSVVIKRLSSCDYFLLYNNRGYIVAEHYSGKEFDEGEKVYGNTNSYGSRDVYDSDLDESEHIYIENWGMSKEDAMALILDKCN